jgi:hypothetical protein
MSVAGFSGSVSCSAFSGGAGSSVAIVDVAKTHPQQSATIDNDKREKKQYCIRFVEMPRPNLFSQCNSGVARALNTRGRLRRAYQSVFCLDDK